MTYGPRCRSLDGLVAAQEEKVMFRRLRSSRPPLVLALAGACIGLASVGIVIGIAQQGGINQPVGFILTTMPRSAPSIAPPGTNQPCVLVPKYISLADAKQHLPFQVFAIGPTAHATLGATQYAQGCDGSLGLGLDYKVDGWPVELVESQATSGTALVHVKSNGGMTAADAGWSTVQIAGEPYAVNTTHGGKGIAAGIVMAVWQIGRTRFTLTPGQHPPDSNGATITPIPFNTFQNIVTNLTVA